MVLGRFFRRSPTKAAALRLYHAVATQSRRPEFYLAAGVPDTVDGRFDLILLNAFLVMHGLRQSPEETAEFQQALFDEIFAHMDQSLREMGVGDARLGRQVKAMAEAFFGRVTAYEEGLAGEEGVLEDALQRNLYGTTDVSGTSVAVMADYVRRQAGAMDSEMLREVMVGQFEFVPLYGERGEPLPARG